MIAIAAALAAAALPLAAHRGHDRMLVVFAADAASAALAAQRRDLDPAADAERDVRVVEVVGDRVAGASDPAAALRARFGVGPRAFRVVLVGKDGRVALDSPAPVTAARLAATIDAMPMRQDEMRRR